MAEHKLTDSPDQAGVYSVSVILLFFSTLAVVLRLGLRKSKQIQIGLDDVFVVVALLFVWALAILLIVGAARGSVGTHTKQNPETGAVQVTWHENDIAKLASISQLLCILCYGFLKASILFLFRRIFVGRIFNKVSIITLVLIAAWTIAFFFANLFECGGNPTWYWHSPKAIKRYCSHYSSIYLGHAVVDVVTDLFVLSIPLPIIWKLHMTNGQKFGLVIVFLMGYISAAAALARMVLLIQSLYVTTVGARDVRGDETNYMVWAYVEAGVGVIAVTLLTLRPLLSLRLPESLVNSARSRMSAKSDESETKTKPRRSFSLDGSSGHGGDVEIAAFDQPKPPPTALRTFTEAGQGDHASFTKLSRDDAILLENSFTVKQEVATIV